MLVGYGNGNIWVYFEMSGKRAVVLMKCKYIFVINRTSSGSMIRTFKKCCSLNNICPGDIDMLCKPMLDNS